MSESRRQTVPIGTATETDFALPIIARMGRAHVAGGGSVELSGFAAEHVAPQSDPLMTLTREGYVLTTAGFGVGVGAVIGGQLGAAVGLVVMGGWAWWRIRRSAR